MKKFLCWGEEYKGDEPISVKAETAEEAAEKYVAVYVDGLKGGGYWIDDDPIKIAVLPMEKDVVEDFYDREVFEIERDPDRWVPYEGDSDCEHEDAYCFRVVKGFAADYKLMVCRDCAREWYEETK